MENISKSTNEQKALCFSKLFTSCLIEGLDEKFSSGKYEPNIAALYSFLDAPVDPPEQQLKVTQQTSPIPKLRTTVEKRKNTVCRLSESASSNMMKTEKVKVKKFKLKGAFQSQKLPDVNPISASFTSSRSAVSLRSEISQQKRSAPVVSCRTDKSVDTLAITKPSSNPPVVFVPIVKPVFMTSITEKSKKASAASFVAEKIAIKEEIAASSASSAVTTDLLPSGTIKAALSTREVDKSQIVSLSTPSLTKGIKPLLPRLMKFKSFHIKNGINTSKKSPSRNFEILQKVGRGSMLAEIFFDDVCRNVLFLSKCENAKCKFDNHKLPDAKSFEKSLNTTNAKVTQELYDFVRKLPKAHQEKFVPAFENVFAKRKQEENLKKTIADSQSA